jgi:hypothetical protein
MTRTIVFTDIVSDDLSTVVSRFLAFRPRKMRGNEWQTAWSFRQKYRLLHLFSGFIRQCAIRLHFLSGILRVIQHCCLELEVGRLIIFVQ